MRVEKVEKILKSKVVYENRRRAKRKKENHSVETIRNKPLKFTEVLALNWQVKNKIFKGCNGKCTFDPVSMQAHSYKHWRFVDVIKGKLVFNNYAYSVTTRGHQWAVKNLLRDLGIKIHLEIETYETLTDFRYSALPVLYELLASHEIAMNRKNIRINTKKRYADAIKEVKSDISKAKKLGAVCTKEEIATIYADAKESEEKRLANLASERISRLNEAKAAKQLEQTAQVIDLNQFAA